ncbi:hypothetical protein EW146_g1737 [Bondarzewia mesenterica]|uniref:Uncharacterized protein n=1 Tax=Bondarzewia mesenterica TaxID=1095465 RepID=A0A4S4M2V9_9AGAM|nr:hypothetical protein EW146_g1737 [Bondarzewia mesenterica]
MSRVGQSSTRRAPTSDNVIDLTTPEKDATMSHHGGSRRSRERIPPPFNANDAEEELSGWSYHHANQDDQTKSNTSFRAANRKTGYASLVEAVNKASRASKDKKNGITHQAAAAKY